MKKTILSIAVIAAAFVAASCQKENLQENTAPEGNASIFTATIETGADTKTTVERVTSPSVAYKTKWENTDKISINGVTYTATPDATDATKATFTKDSGADPTGTYNAYFPATMFDGTKATLPASYTYADGKYNMPMYAQSSTTSLPFKNLCGVLAITVKGTDFTSVSSIEVSSDQQMNGDFTATAEGVLSFESKTLEDADKKVALNFDTAKSIESAGSATFYIPVPAGTHNPLTIKVTGGSTTKTMVTKKSGGVAVARNTVYPITFVDNFPTKGTAKRTGDIDVNWVQLWAGGPRFAEYNVGAENNKPEDYGCYYGWGGTEDKNKNDYNKGSVPLTGDYDTATNLWGSNWRMPTTEELDALRNDVNCTCTWTEGYNGSSVNGWLCTGKGAYSSNSIFVPAAGYFTGVITINLNTRGRYWSSTPDDEDNSDVLVFASDGIRIEIASRSHGHSVRAVLAE